MKSIFTANGDEILVSDADYPMVSKHLWHINSADGVSRINLEPFTFDEIADVLEAVYIHKVLK